MSVGGKEQGRLLCERRVQAGLSLRDAARIVGCSDVEYGEVERGIRCLTVEAERRLANAINAARRGGEHG